MTHNNKRMMKALADKIIKVIEGEGKMKDKLDAVAALCKEAATPSDPVVVDCWHPEKM